MQSEHFPKMLQPVKDGVLLRLQRDHEERGDQLELLGLKQHPLDKGRATSSADKRLVLQLHLSSVLPARRPARVERQHQEDFGKGQGSNTLRDQLDVDGLHLREGEGGGGGGGGEEEDRHDGPRRQGSRRCSWTNLHSNAARGDSKHILYL